VKLCVLELLWQNISATKSQRHKKPQKIKNLKSNVNLNFKQSLNSFAFANLSSFSIKRSLSGDESGEARLKNNLNVLNHPPVIRQEELE
jgi:hypothetical protein